MLIARLMLEPADLLLLDEPTNDLDIPTLEILEEALLEYPGAMILVTHDRYMLDRVSNVVLGLDGMGGASSFADYGQWEEWQRASRTPKPPSSAANGSSTNGNSSSSKKKKLSYLEQRDWETIEARIEQAEAEAAAKQARLEDPAVAVDAGQLQLAIAEAAAAQETVDSLYERWGELGAKQA